MKIKCSWWVDSGFSFEGKLLLRKKLAEFSQVTLENSEGDFVIAWVDERELLQIITESINEIKSESNSWIWVTFRGDRSLIDSAEIAKLIAGKTDYAVYSFLNDKYLEITPELYRQFKHMILSNEIPVFCLNESGSLHDGKSKVILDFLGLAMGKKIIIKTGNPRYGHIIQKELENDQKLKNNIKVNIDWEKEALVLNVSAKTPAILERATNLVIRKAKAFRLTVLII